jgi:hypothetical protein
VLREGSSFGRYLLQKGSVRLVTAILQEYLPFSTRVSAFKRRRPLSLYATIRLPEETDGIDGPGQLSGFIRLINLYKSFDDTFFGFWNRSSDGTSPSWLALFQQKLSDALPAYMDYKEVQLIDLKESQQWLRAMVWQLALSHGFVSPMAVDDVLKNKFLLDICQELILECNTFSHQAMEVHGLVLVSPF